MKKIKIIQVLHSVGGVDVWLRLMLSNIDSDNYENVIVHGIDDTNKEFFDSRGNSIKEYKVPILRPISPINDLKSIYRTIKIVRKEKPDLIHAHSAKGGVIGRVVGIITGTKVLYTPHAFSYLSEKSKPKRFLFRLIEKVLSKGNNILLATSNSEQSRAINEVGYKSEKTIVFNNCITPIFNIENLSTQKTWTNEYICTVGRPSYQKNIDLMIRIIAEIKKERKIHLIVMGVGFHADQLDIVKELILDLNLSENVTLLNWTSREDVLNIISSSKLYISTSRYEGLPYSVIEALALSKPCVVSNCDGNKDLIEDGYNGYVIKNYNIENFKNQILELLKNEDLLNKMSKNAHQSFLDKYNIEKNIIYLENIYSKEIKK
jgi:glycosyltransferase involved in cell wall biosynthesis